MDNDSQSSSVDGNGDTMEEELTFKGKGRSYLKESRFVLRAAGDLD